MSWGGGGGGGGGRGTEDGEEGMIHKWFLCGHFKAHQKVLRISEECVTPHTSNVRYQMVLARVCVTADLRKNVLAHHDVINLLVGFLSK